MMPAAACTGQIRAAGAKARHFTRLRALDLFCGAGGATRGLQMAGFHVTGVDIKPQLRYVGDEFHQADALTFPLGGYDFIWASPPCQAHTALKTMWNSRMHEDLIPATRARLKQSGAIWVMENVPGSTLEACFFLCGSMFGLGVEAFDGWRQLRRHRWFESPLHPLVPRCNHQGEIYGDHARDRRGIDFPDAEKLGLGQAAMQMPWADWKGISQAIPPAYAEFIGRRAMEFIREAAVA